jgi:hypothetical protein
VLLEGTAPEVREAIAIYEDVMVKFPDSSMRIKPNLERGRKFLLVTATPLPVPAK